MGEEGEVKCSNEIALTKRQIKTLTGNKCLTLKNIPQVLASCFESQF